MKTRTTIQTRNKIRSLGKEVDAINKQLNQSAGLPPEAYLWINPITKTKLLNRIQRIKKQVQNLNNGLLKSDQLDIFRDG